MSAPTMARIRKPGECCAICDWRRSEHHDDVRIRCGLIEGAGQRDLLSGDVFAWKDAGDWCERFERGAPHV